MEYRDGTPVFGFLRLALKSDKTTNSPVILPDLLQVLAQFQVGIKPN